MRVHPGKLTIAVGVGVVGLALASQQRRPPRRTFRGSTVLITGGSRGLGLELARCWAKEGARVVICARTTQDIQRAVNELRQQGYDAAGFTCDVTSQEDVNDWVATVLDRYKTIDVLVNNAGIIQVGPQECMTFADYQRAFNTHLWGPLYTVQAVLPHMRGRRAGSIVNIASIGGEISVPHLLPYNASKFALVGLSEGLCAELARDGIYVTTVCPGIMRTGSPRNALFKGQHRKEYTWFSLGASMPVLSISSPRAAGQIVEACREGLPYLAISLPSKAAVRFRGLFPNLTARLMQTVNLLLPRAGGIGPASREGKDSFSHWSPSKLTWLNDRASTQNNEVR